MNNFEVVAHIAVSLFRTQMEPDWDDTTLEEKAQRAFRFAAHGDYDWMAPQDEDGRFKIGIVILLQNLEKGSDDYDRIHAEFESLVAIDAAARGLPIDLEAALSRVEEIKPLGLIGIFREVANG